MAAAPVTTAKGRASALRMFTRFMSLFALSWATLTTEDVADYVAWRAVPPTDASIPQPPWGAVLPATAMGDIAHLRAHLALLGDERTLAAFYGTPITMIFRRIGSDKHDAVRKTPIQYKDVIRLCQTAATATAAAVALAFFLLMRGGELAAMTMAAVTLTPTYCDVTFFRQKARAGIAALAVTRRCTAPPLIDILNRYMMERGTAAGPLFPTLTTTADVRRLFTQALGTPPTLPGEKSPLPWSARAGGASAMFAADVDPEKLMKYGRWASRIAMMYCVLTPHAQAEAWKGAAEWWVGA